MSSAEQQTIVVIGSGMVGLRFCEQLTAFDERRRYKLVVFCEEARSAYDRAGLFSFTAQRDAEKLLLARRDWYEAVGITLHLADRAIHIDRDRHVVRSMRGVSVEYDHLILAMGAYPSVPSVPGIQKQGVFVYRTADDLEHILTSERKFRSCAVLGGGLSAMEIAGAVFELGLRTHVIQSESQLMSAHLDRAGSHVLLQRIRDLGVSVHLSKTLTEVRGESHIQGVLFEDGSFIDCEMLVVSDGICSRDDLARQAGIHVGEHGGIKVNNRLQTIDPRIFAIGECALHAGTRFGITAPGYAMAETVAANFCGDSRPFDYGDLSAKLSLLGVDVACFGQWDPELENAAVLSEEDAFAGVYRKLLFTMDGKRLLGGILVGDASDYMTLAALAKTGTVLPCLPQDLMLRRCPESSASGSSQISTHDSVRIGAPNFRLDGPASNYARTNSDP
jgi:nitrite reductase (NADH) large subunit